MSYLRTEGTATGRQSRTVRLIEEILFFSVVSVAAIAFWQNHRMRDLLNHLARPDGPGARVVRPRLSPGDQIKRSLENGSGVPEAFSEIAGRSPRFWWLFDPACQQCRTSAMALASHFSSSREPVPFAAIALGMQGDARDLLEQYDIRVEVYSIDAGRPYQFQAVPQFFEVDACGTVVRIFTSDEDFVDAIAERAP